jgi:hypothetical protein
MVSLLSIIVDRKIGPPETPSAGLGKTQLSAVKEMTKLYLVPDQIRMHGFPVTRGAADAGFTVHRN